MAARRDDKAGLATMTHGFGALPTRGFSSGDFEGIDKISGEALRI